jgi:hypothetical protein
MAHAYWGFRCKTPGCLEFHIVKYIGEHDGRLKYFHPDKMPSWTDWCCMECGSIHKYMRHEMESIVLDQSPPPKFVPWF